jgi:3-methyladenine DNA glycosylase AlkD
MATARLIETLRRAMRAEGDPERALAQRAYMKSEMPYHGLSAMQMRAICKRVSAGYDAPFETWQRDVLSIWRAAKFREERYAAVELASIRHARPFHTIDALPMFEEMIVSGAWWDYVDAIATHNLHRVLVQDRSTKRVMLAWSRDEDIWKRRSAILCQIPAKGQTDTTLLYACIEPSLERKEFWLRKAIGWALRQYARTDPEEVARYVASRGARISPLSKREALKHVTSSPAHEGPRKSASGDRRTPSRGRRASSRTGG